MSRFVLRDGLIAEYHESVNGGVAMHQLGVEPARMDKVFARWTPGCASVPVQAYLARPRRGQRLRHGRPGAPMSPNDREPHGLPAHHLCRRCGVATITLNRRSASTPGR